MQSFVDFAEFYCIDKTAVAAINKYLIDTNGRDTVIILDGYDELPEKVRLRFKNILQSKSLSNFRGMVIVTSRPNVSNDLHDLADRTVEILGFTDLNRKSYINQALGDNHEEIQALTDYLNRNPAVNAYCYIPLNMTILLNLFKELSPTSELPKTQTEINKIFICITISRFIRRLQNTDINISNFAAVPLPFKNVFSELCHLAFIALQDDRIVFTKTEIQSICPNLTLQPKDWNGLGLLKAVQFYDFREVAHSVSFNFLHLSIQEILAAYYITLLPRRKQVQLLKAKFWDSRYFNTWVMYVGLTKGQSFEFKHFLSANMFQLFTRFSLWRSQNTVISRNIISDKIKRLHLFQCFSEAENNEMCQYVSQLLQDNKIDLSGQVLTAVNSITLSLFLTQSTVKHWEIINISECYMRDEGFQRFHASFTSNNRSKMSINCLDISSNDLSEASVALVANLAVLWNVKRLILSSNDIQSITVSHEISTNQDFQNKFIELVCDNHYTLIASNIDYSRIMENNNYSCIFLLKCTLGKSFNECLLPLLQKGTDLFLYDCDLPLEQTIHHVFHKEVLSFHLITNNIIPDNDVASVINKYLMTVKFAVTLGEKSLPLHIYNAEAKPPREIKETLSQMSQNGTFVLHGISHRTIGKVLNAFRKVNTIRGFWFNNCITEMTDKQMAVLTKILKQQCSSLDYLAITSTGLTEKLTGKFSIDYLMMLQHLSFLNCRLSKDDIMAVCNAAKTITNLNEFNLSGNNIDDQAGEALADAIVVNTKLQKLVLSNCNLTEECMKLVLIALQKCKYLEMLDLEGNTITDLVVSHLAALLNNNSHFKSLGISNAALYSAEFGLFTKALTLNLSLKYIDLSYNKLLHSEVTEINTVLSNCLEHLDFSDCGLQEMIVVEVTESLLTTSNLNYLNLSGNKVNSLAANNIAAVVSKNSNISSFSIADCQLSVNDLMCICESMKSTSNLRHIDISFNPVNDEAALHLAAVILSNIKLTHINLSNCKLQEIGYRSVLTAIGQASRLLYFDFTLTPFVSGTAENLKFSGCSLEHLCLSNCSLHGKEMMKIIHISKYLKGLDISSNTITDKEASKLAEAIKFSRLQYLNISECQLQTNGLLNICNSIKKITTITCIDFSGNKIGSYAAELLAEAIIINETLQKLILSNCNLDAIGIMHIVVAIKQLSTLTHLDFKCNWIPEKAFLTLAEAISENNMEYLDLYNCLTDGDISVLVVAIANCRTLRHINIGSCRITASLVYIFSISIDKTNLQHFTLNVDTLCDQDIVRMFNAMAKIKSLRCVDFGTFSITDAISQEIKEVTTSNKRLKCFKTSNLSMKSLRNNKLLVILKDIIYVEEMHIDGIDINDDQADMIIDILAKNTSIHAFHFTNCNASDLVKEKIVKTLNTRTVLTLRELKLSNIPGTKQMIKELSTLLANNPDLEYLGLSKCELSEQNVLQIAEFLTNRKKLSTLDLSNNKLSDYVLGKVFLRTKESHFTGLSLSGNPISNNSSGTVISLVDLISSNCTINYLDLSRCSLNFLSLQAIVKALKQCTVLEYLDLSNNDITGKIDLDFASIITGSPKIKYLYLSNYQFTNKALKDGFTSMKSISSLEIVDMRGNEITDLAVHEISAALYRNKNIEKLMFSDFKVSKEGFPHLAIYLTKFYGLKHINIAECMLSDLEAGCFAEMISNNSNTVKTINLQSCSISDAGKCEIFISLKMLQQLSHINISYIVIPEQVEEEVETTFTVNKNMEKIEMAGCSVSKAGLDKIIDAMTSSQSLSYIDLSHNKMLQFGTKLACTISHQRTLHTLKLNNSNLKAEGIQAICKSLAQLTTLRCIDLKEINVENDILSDFVKVISSNKKIEKLSFPNVAYYTYSGVKVIANALKLVSTLTYLDMNTIEINSEVAKGFMELVLSNRKLKVLKSSKLRLNFKSYKEFKIFVNKLYGLDTICIFGTTFDSTVLTTLISNNEQVQHLNLANCKILDLHELTKFTNVLQNNTSIQHLNLNNITLYDIAVNKLAAAISQFSKLSHLEMSGCKLSKNGFEMLTFALKFTKNLVYLNLNHNKIVSARTVANLSELLYNCYCLTHLCLSNCALNSTYLRKIADSLKCCTSLKYLDLSMNNIVASKVINEIAEGIIQSNQLEHLCLPNCYLCSNDLHLLLNTLRKLKRLQLLDLTPNEVDSNNVENLAAVMHANQDLVKLVLSKINVHKIRLKTIDTYFAKIKGLDSILITNCEVDSNDCDNLIKLIVNNSKLVETLSFENCKISNEDFSRLTQAMDSILGLQYLNLSSIMLTGNMTNEVVEIIDKNKQLISLDLAACVSDDTDQSFLVKAICSCKNLVYLNLSDNNLSHHDMGSLCLAISGLAFLQQLRLSNCKLTAKEVNHFKKFAVNVSLRYLDLSNNMLNDQPTYQTTTWTWFFNFTRIEHLDLSCCRLQANELLKVAKVLGRVDTIRYLDLSVKNVIESKLDSVANHLAKVITNNKNFEHLYLKNFTFSPFSLKRLLQVMAKNSSLRQIVLNKACFDNALASCLAAVMAANQNLVYFEASSLMLNCDKSHDFIQFKHLELRKMKALQVIKINAIDFTEKDEAGLVKSISNSPSIETFSVHNCTLSYNTKLDLLTALKKIKSLKQLSFVNIPIIDEVAYKLADAVLANKCTIKDVDFNKCNLLSKGFLKCVDAFCQCETLLHLNLSYNKVVGQEIDILLPLLGRNKKLQRLILQKCELTTDDIYKVVSALKDFSALRCIDLGLNHMESRIVSTLAAAISNNKMIVKVVLPTCTLKNGDVEIIVSACCSVSKLQYIDLSFTYITTDLVKNFAGIFVRNEMLKEVKIVKLALDQDGLRQMSQYLSKVVGLKHFSVTDCQLTDTDENSALIAIQRNLELQEFSLAGCEISDHGINIILTQLTFIASLTLLHLNGINIPNESEDTIAQVITNNVELKNLEMAGCNFRDFGIKKVFDALKNHSNLLYFNFSHNKLNVETFKTLADVIANFKSLHQLRLTNCGEIPFSRVLKLLSLPHLKILNMSNNIISGSAFQNVNRRINNCLQHLNFTNCNLSVENAETLVSTLRNCRSPVKLVLRSNPLPAHMLTEFQRILTY